MSVFCGLWLVASLLGLSGCFLVGVGVDWLDVEVEVEVEGGGVL